jgi:hypothetical protein
VGDAGEIRVDMRETSGTGTPTTSDQLTDLVFGIKWSQSYGSGLDLLTPSNSYNYNITKSGTRATKSTTYYFQAFYANNTPFSIPSDWTPAGTWVPIMSITNNLGGNPGTGTFEICENGFDGTTNPSFQLNLGTYYVPSVNGQADEVPTPVELSSFTALVNKNASVSLKWQTATEVNNYGFEVERRGQETEVRIQNSEWERIGFVTGNGNSNSPKDYSFIDKNLTGGSKFTYRLKQVDNDGTYSYSSEVEVEVIPDRYELYQNYPNPFNPVTNIKFSLPEAARVKVDVFNIIGEKVITLIDQNMEAGFHSITFNAENLSSGTYIYRLQTENFTQIKKMLLLK